MLTVARAQDVIALEGDEEGEGIAEPVVNLDLRTALEGMITAMRTKESQKRVAFKIPFVLGKDLSIGIVGCVRARAAFAPLGDAASVNAARARRISRTVTT